jgi:hypothetical protein
LVGWLVLLWIVAEYAGSGQCDRFCSKLSVLTGLPMMP